MLSSCAAPAIPQETKAVDPVIKTYFVQIWTEKQQNQDMTLYDGEDPGRVEIYEGEDVNNTVACVQFKSVKDWNAEQLANISVGFTYRGDKKNLRVKLYGAALRLVKVEQKISEKPTAGEGG